MRNIGLVLAASSMIGSGAAAQSGTQSFANCEKVEIAAIEAAIAGAYDLALQASVQVGETEDYLRWFGAYSRRNAEVLRRNFKSVYGALRTETLTGQCLNSWEDACKGGTFAFINRARPFHINYCPPFFRLPTMIGVSPTEAAMENGTQEGTIIHEVSHFEQTANTDDLCYSRSECMDMARRDPVAALRNADTYQYFAEDVILYADRPGD